jgi:hypothetical protein
MCALKHVSQAGILTMEARQGYPIHRWWALGHLAEASDELINDYPETANEVREMRKIYEEDEEVNLPFNEMLATLSMMVDKEIEDVKAEEEKARQPARKPAKRTRAKRRSRSAT